MKRQSSPCKSPLCVSPSLSLSFSVHVSYLNLFLGISFNYVISFWRSFSLCLSASLWMQVWILSVSLPFGSSYPLCLPVSQPEQLKIYLVSSATHSSIFPWRIPWTEEPGGLQSMGSQRVGHNQATNTLVSQSSFFPFKSKENNRTYFGRSSWRINDIVTRSPQRGAQHRASTH